MAVALFQTGCVPNLPDIRDKQLAGVSMAEAAQFSRKYSILQYFSDRYDQGLCNSCVGNSIAGAIRLKDVMQGGTAIQPSRLGIYYFARKEDGWEGFDGGASIRSGFKAVQKTGVIPEDLWAYDLSKLNVQPPDSAIQEASRHQVLEYLSVQPNNGAIKAAILAGYPVVFGMTLYENYQATETLRTGHVSQPQGRIIGGHAMFLTGWDDDTSEWESPGSWGRNVGNQGVFYIPYNMVESPQMSFDHTAVRVVEEIDTIVPPTPQPQPDPSPKPQPIPPTPAAVFFDGTMQKVKSGGAALITPDNIETARKVSGRVRVTKI